MPEPEQQAQQLTPAEREAMTAAWDAEGNLRPWHFLSFDLAQAAERVFVAGRAAALGAVAASPDEEKLGLDYRGIGAQRWAGETVEIAYCPEHGLHGARKTCFECGKPCEQVPMRVAGSAGEEHRPT